jgi:hypothetical protein
MSARSAVLTASAVLTLALAGCGGGSSQKPAPPPAEATTLVPRDALVYVHLSTDAGRDATKAALSAAQRFSGYDRARTSLLKRLSAPGCRVQTGKGKEAALALLNSKTGTAGSLVIVDSGDDKPVDDRICGAVKVVKIGRFSVIGQPASIAAARALHAGKGVSLAGDPLYKRTLSELPADRVLDAWVTKDGVRRLLAPQPGLLGIAGLLLDQPKLRAVAASLSAQGKDGARVVVKSLKTSAATARPFAPTLQNSVPDGAFAYLGVRGLRGVGARLLAFVPGSQKDLASVTKLFSGETAVILSYAVPAPILTLVTRTADEAAARKTLSQGLKLPHAVFGGKVVVSTKPAGIDAVRTAKQHLPDTKAWAAVERNTRNPVTSLVFLDFSQLLRLAERTGLNDSSAYKAVKADLLRVKRVGARSSGTGDETTAELLLSIP